MRNAGLGGERAVFQLLVFAALIVLLVPILVVGALALFSFAWAHAAALVQWRIRRRASRADHERTHLPDGTPLPPVARGLCEECELVFDDVCHLPDGRRLCRECFALRSRFPDASAGLRPPRRVLDDAGLLSVPRPQARRRGAASADSRSSP